MVQDHQSPRRVIVIHLVLKPVGLHRVAGSAIRLARVAIQNKEVNRPFLKIVVSPIAGQGEVIQIRLDRAGVPIVIAQRGRKRFSEAPGPYSPW
jgi:hypothetical protein